MVYRQQLQALVAELAEYFTIYTDSGSIYTGVIMGGRFDWNSVGTAIIVSTNLQSCIL
jgi:hypothetical protein